MTTGSDFNDGLTGSYKVGLFGVPVQWQSAQVIVAPVPWDVTTSYGKGTSKGPEAILKASPQVDLFDIELKEAWRLGYAWDPSLMGLERTNQKIRPLAEMVMSQLEEQGQLKSDIRQLQSEVNSACDEMVQKVYEFSMATLKQGKLLGLVGGDHSTPEGYLKALCEIWDGDFGVLHIDAHHDLRDSYQGFQHSHASIMHNLMNFQKPPRALVQVAIRDFSREEYDFATTNPKITTFWDRDLKSKMFLGASWQEICTEILGALPERVYISFDIDGLSPDLCPSTGTPVPGGLSFDQAIHLLQSLGRSDKKLVGFDLNEVAPSQDGGEWDANVGCRILFQLCGWLAVKGQTRRS